MKFISFFLSVYNFPQGVVSWHVASQTFPESSFTVITTETVCPDEQSQFTCTAQSITLLLVSESGNTVIVAQSEFGPVVTAACPTIVRVEFAGPVAWKVILAGHSIPPVGLKAQVIVPGVGPQPFMINTVKMLITATIEPFRIFIMIELCLLTLFRIFSFLL